MKPLLFFALLSSLVACGSNKPAPTNPRDPVEAKSGWFCQVGLADDTWECVQDPVLAASPKPTRLPKVQRVATASDAPSFDSTINAPPPSTRTNTPTSSISEAFEAEVTPRVVASQPKEPSPLTDLPRHIELSYRPEKPVALVDIPADFFAVQLVAVSSKASLEAFAKQHNIRGMSAARTWNGNKMFYVLLLGIYETEINAKASIESLAPPFDNMSPWIRNVGSLQRAILAADQEAGTPEI